MRTSWVLAGLCLACGRGGAGTEEDTSQPDITTERSIEIVEDSAGNPCTVDVSSARVGVVASGPGVGAYASAAVAPDGSPCVAYAAGVPGASTATLRVSCLRPQGWSAREVPPPVEVDPTWFGRSVALVMLPDGHPFLFYHSAGGGGLLGVRESDQGWTITTVDSKEGAGLDVSAQMGPGGTLHVAYLDLADGDLRYARGAPDMWEVEVADTDGFTGNDPSIGVDREGRVHISYFGCGGLTPSGCSGELRYAVRGPAGFVSEVVEAGDDTGWYSSLVLDDRDVPHVAWHARGPGRLRHATREDGTWRIEEVDPGPDAGAFASLVLVGGSPVIAYCVRDPDGLAVAIRTSAGTWSRSLLPGNGAGTFSSLVRLAGCNLFGAWRAPDGLVGAFF